MGRSEGADTSICTRQRTLGGRSHAAALLCHASHKHKTSWIGCSRETLLPPPPVRVTGFGFGPKHATARGSNGPHFVLPERPAIHLGGCECVLAVALVERRARHQDLRRHLGASRCLLQRQMAHWRAPGFLHPLKGTGNPAGDLRAWQKALPCAVGIWRSGSTHINPQAAPQWRAGGCGCARACARCVWAWGWRGVGGWGGCCKPAMLAPQLNALSTITNMHQHAGVPVHCRARFCIQVVPLRRRPFSMCTGQSAVWPGDIGGRSMPPGKAAKAVPGALARPWWVQQQSFFQIPAPAPALPYPPQRHWPHTSSSPMILFRLGRLD